MARKADALTNRFYIQATRTFFEVPGQFNDLGFGEVVVDVVYGDTDSLMIALEFADPTVKRALELGALMVKKINAAGIYAPPMEVAFECSYSPMLLLGPKKYICLKHVEGKKVELKESGTVTVKRDNAPFVSNANAELNKLIMDSGGKDRDAAITGFKAYVKSEVQRLLLRQVPWKDLITTQALNMEMDEYDGSPMHVRVVQEWARLRPGTEPKVGDRIPYVICLDGPHPPFCVADMGRIPDVSYYLQRKMRNPIVKTMMNFISKQECDELFDERRYEHFQGQKVIKARTVTVRGSKVKPRALQQLDIGEMMRRVSRE